MPQSSEELRSEWGVDYDAAITYLESQGFVLNRGFFWTPPQEGRICTETEKRALQFLVEEWDFGGVKGCGCEQELM